MCYSLVRQASRKLRKLRAATVVLFAIEARHFAFKEGYCQDLASARSRSAAFWELRETSACGHRASELTRQNRSEIELAKKGKAKQPQANGADAS